MLDFLRNSLNLSAAEQKFRQYGKRPPGIFRNVCGKGSEANLVRASRSPELNRIVVFSVAALLLAAIADAQSPNSQPTYLSQPPFPAANIWMTIPVQWSPANDTVPASVRQARDQYFDQLIGYKVPLTPANVKGSGLSEGVPLPNLSEIPEVPDRTVLIATFTSYQPVLSSTGRSIYTEATFLVSNTFQDSSGRAAPGTSFVLVIPGGTVSADGLVLPFLVQPRQYSVAVGGKYLVVMSYHANGDFFILGRDWDVTSGVVKANFSSRPGSPSSLIGLSVSQLVTALNAQFGNK